ncbi:hypothetical protein [Rhodoferax sp. GW822-FHT02A01]|uniref:hypothetical protein n=1 Tax=Rhodoferax sp. GW822-FHT02A01 TaxID=3141537 RepID=UPI00315D08C8
MERPIGIGSDALRRKARSLLFSMTVAGLVSGCGGGGGGGAPSTTTQSNTTTTTSQTTTVTATAGVEGLFKDASQTRLRYLLVEPDGQLWGTPSVLYSTGSTSLGVALEANKGNISATSGNVTGTYKDIIGLTCSFLYTCTVSGLSSPTQLSVSGSKSLSGSTIPDWSFTGTPEASYSVQAAASDIAGTWNMNAALPSNMAAFGTLTVSSTGAVTVTNIGSCAFTGTLTPVTGKGYFRLTVSTVAGTCATGTTAAQINGVAFKTSVTGKPSVLNVMWHNTNQSQYFWAAGTP